MDKAERPYFFSRGIGESTQMPNWPEHGSLGSGDGSLLEHSYHSDCIIEQGLAKDDDKQSLIDVHFLKDSQHSYRVHC